MKGLFLIYNGTLRRPTHHSTGRCAIKPRSAGEFKRWAFTMRAYFSTLVCAITLLAGSAYGVGPGADGDPFTGTYRFDNAEKGAGYFLVKRHSNGSWYILVSKDGESQPIPFPGPPTPDQLTIAPADGIKAMFQEKSPIEQISCLAIIPSGPAVICRMPKGAPYQLISGMSRPNMIEAKTGYIMILATPAGAMTFNMDRTVDAQALQQNETNSLAVPSYSSTFSRYTEELSSLLEQEAASAMARSKVADSAKTLCERLGGDVAQDVANEAIAWRSRNAGYLKAAAQVFDELGNRYIPVGGEEKKQSYLHVMRVEIEKIVGASMRWRFGAANLENAIVPSPGQCMRAASSLQSGHLDFRNTPDMIKALVPYMDRKGLPGRRDAQPGSQQDASR